MKKTARRTKGLQESRKLLALARQSLFGLSLFLSLEWLFLVTKPSFFSALSWFERLRVLFSSLGVLLVPILCLFILLVPVSRLVPWPPWRWTAALIPTVTLSFTALLLVDNFTSTLFGVGVKTIEGRWRGIYLLLLLTAATIVFRRVLDRCGRSAPSAYSWAAGLAVLMAALSLFSHWWNDPGVVLGEGRSGPGQKTLPNIVILSSDGLNSSHLSLYGYDHATTPFLEILAESSLVAENCFTNGGPTAASITSRLTGKWPTQTRVIYPPDILRGTDSYQHLPGVLRRMGYTALDLSIRHYADSADLNFREAFDMVNFRLVKRQAIYAADWIPLDASYFLAQLQDRLFSRLQKIFFNLPMDDAFEEVTEGDRSYKRDPKRMEQLFTFIESHPEPFFAHVHLMGTHGSRFRTHHRVFSAGLGQDRDWMVEFYDDAILDFDSYVRQLADFLEEQNLLQRTVLVVGSDHGQRARTADRIPLLIRFPEGHHSGRLTPNVQNLDIAPTLLDYLGAPAPPWMVGRSLLSDRLESHYPILAANRGGTPTIKTERGRELKLSEIRPPFYSLGRISVIVCKYAYQLHLESGIIIYYTIPDHTDTCSEPPKASEIENILLDHLRNQSYDTGSLRPPLQVFETAHGF